MRWWRRALERVRMWVQQEGLLLEIIDRKEQ